ncbi:hypothetical protein KCH_75080 [Kitasatospora cheerisanensis KCTC 2395]|uniref:Uncharacterized protein n=1 Tax=Kitasatospora cheerisanensis KCTC 2395 TaxID=1348663 RepID=A0A066YGY2_9ACTN|nr:hypothetical protein KCH_75080 [Kitasatospora cheerisanensis KCTC 2395]
MHLTMVLLLTPLVLAGAVTARTPARRGRHRAGPRRPQP